MVNAEELITKKELTAADRIKIAVFASMLKEADISRVIADAQTALNEDANYINIVTGKQIGRAHV